MPSLHACEYSRVREYNTRHTRVRTSNERTQYTRTRIYSVYTQASPTPKESGGLGYEASVSTARESRERVRFRVLPCTRASTRVCVCEYSRATRARHARAVKLLVSGTVGTCTCNKTMACRNSVTCAGTTSAAADHTTECGGWPQIT